jgi:hypothetical protein
VSALAPDTELLGWVSEIHQRACQRIGQLSAELEKARPNKGHGVLTGEKTKAQALLEAGISVPTAHRYEQLVGKPYENGLAISMEAAMRSYDFPLVGSRQNRPWPKRGSTSVPVSASSSCRRSWRRDSLLIPEFNFPVVGS